ncbi:hypothetical protein GCM10020331_028970 [Ectobacillus funiculus]
MHAALVEKGFTFDDNNPDFVVMGIDRDITYEKLAKSMSSCAQRCNLYFDKWGYCVADRTRYDARKWFSYLCCCCVNGDKTYFFIGKPESIITEQALKVIGTTKEETIMVGDNYDTDIMAGIQAGLDTLLVHTGVTTVEKKLREYETQPTHVIHSLTEWIEKI